MERHYIKDLIKSMFRMDSDGNSNCTNGNSNEDLLSISYSTDDEADIPEMRTSLDNTPKPPNYDGVHHSPGEGLVAPRSVKEVEESHATLKKENFNLKLRIYFLEERMNTDFNINPDNAVMKNIELKVQVEGLRKELTEKQEMLCQAVKTMELDEDDYKKLLAERDKKVCDLERDYQSLHRKYEQDLERSHGDIILSDPDHMYRSYDIEALETKLDEEQGENVRLRASMEEEVRARDLRISCLQAEVEERSAIVTEQHKRCVALESDMEKRYMDIKRLKDEHGDDSKRIVDLEGSLRDAHQAIETVETEYEQECLKVNRMKLSLSQRNKRIMELEDIVRRQKTHIGTLEAQVRHGGGGGAAGTPVQTSCVATSTVSICAQYDGSALSVAALNNTPHTPSTIIHPQQQQSPDIDVTAEELTSASEHLRDLNCLDAQASDKDLQESRRHILKLEKDRRRAGEIIHSMLEKRKQLTEEIRDLKAKETDKDREIAQLKQVIGGIHDDRPSGGEVCADGLTVVDRSTVAPSSAEIKIDCTTTDETDICTKYQTLANDLDKQKTILLAIIAEKDAQMQKIQLDYNIIQTDVTIKHEHIIHLQNQIKQNTHHNTSCEKLDTGTEKQLSSTTTEFWLTETQEKDRHTIGELSAKNNGLEQILRNKNNELDQLAEEIRLLKVELLKFTADQSISSLVISESNNNDVQEKLRNSIADRKRLLDQIEVMYVDSEYPKDYMHLKNEYKQLKDEFERSERLRAQTNEICSVLSGRLEELAFFLDTLLKQKCLLGFLGSKKNGKLRQIIDRSLDLSRTLNTNLSELNADQSLLQLTNISNFFNSATASSAAEDATNETDLREKSQLIGEQARIIKVLQKQLDASKDLCKYDDSVANILKDISTMDEVIKSPQMILQNLQSDKLRINQRDLVANLDDDESSESCYSEPDLNKNKPAHDGGRKRFVGNKRLMHENRDLKRKLTTNGDLLQKTQESHDTITAQLHHELEILNTLRAENDLLSKRIRDNDTQFNQQQCTAQELRDTIGGLESDNMRAHADYEQLRGDKVRVDDALRRERELVGGQAADFRGQLERLRAHTEDEVKRITETALTMKQRYESEYVKRAELDKMMSSIKELESLQMVLNTTEEKIQLLEGNEARLKGTLQDVHVEYRERLADLRKELDLSTLKYSEVMLERTRQAKERGALEQQIKEYARKEEDFRRQVADFQLALDSMKEVFQVQVANLNSQKSALQLKLTEVEVVNDELRSTVDRGCRRETSKTTPNSAPSTPSKFFSLLIGRQFSYTHEPTPSSPLFYTAHESGDNQPTLLKNDTAAIIVGASAHDTPCDNGGGSTSPDLGIESDQGRFSSLENNGGASVECCAPFYSALELSQQMRSLLVTDEGRAVAAEGTIQQQQVSNKKMKNCNNDGCLNVIVENSQLRDKLLRTRSALEETVSQLKYANDKKRHVEKTICKQIHKTSQVLRKAKANLDSGSDTDILRK